MFLLLLSRAVHPDAGAAELVREGKPIGEIVVAESSTRVPKFAARELQEYIEKLSGAKLPIVSQPTPGVPSRVYVGKSGYTDKLGLETDGLKYGAYRIAAGKDWLALLGPDKDFQPIEPWGRSRSKTETDRINAEFDKITGDTFFNSFRELYLRQHEELGIWDYDDLGTLNAVYAYLRGLGVRWYAPGKIGEVVPAKPSIEIPAEQNEAVKPDFPVRRISYFHEFLGKPELALWNLRLGTNYAHDLIGITQMGHGIKFVIMRDEMKRNHPEMYALWDGKPATDHKGGQGAPRLSSALLKEKQLKYAGVVFDHYNEPMVSIDVVDGFSGRISEDDRALATPERGWAGSMSDYLWGYVNSVASELYKSHPDRFVSGLSYGAYTLPPEKIEVMSPNLAIVECRNRSRFNNPAVRAASRELRQAWLKKLPSGMYLTWDYYLHAWPARDPGRPIYYPHLIAEDLKELKGISLGESIEVYDHRPDQRSKFPYDEFAVNHLNIYATACLWWDADQSVDALLDDYYTNYFGPARAQMKAFVEYSEANWPEMNKDAGKIARAFALLDAAQKAAPGGSVYAERIELIAQYMKPLKAMEEELLAGRQNIPEAVAPTRDVANFILDGKLDGDFWKAVPSHSFRDVKTGEAVKEPTEFMAVMGSDGMLYLGIRCRDSDMKNLNAPLAKNGDPEIWSGDFVEVEIETPDHSYYQISVGPNGTLIDLDRGETLNDSWESGAQVAVDRGPDEWTVEMRIPPAGATAAEIDPNTGISGDKPTKADPWYINVCRLRSRGGVAEASAWSPTGGTFHKPAAAAQKAFGRLYAE